MGRRDKRGPAWEHGVFLHRERAVCHRSASQLPSKGTWSQLQGRLSSKSHSPSLFLFLMGLFDPRNP